ncbi:PDF receptor [Schistosoma japonicum]|nr:PDF receptor [Schistosoma japonicum]
MKRMAQSNCQEHSQVGNPLKSCMNFNECHGLHLFFALLLESIAQLILSYLLLSKIDQISLNNVGNETIHQTLSHQRQIISTSNTKSNTMIIIWELSQTCVFTWTFIEGIHIHELIVVSVFQSSVNMYPLMLAAWKAGQFIRCIQLTGYRIMNMAFLINVIRVLVRRLQTNDAPEIQKLRKAVKAAVLLMPLLGITNFIVLLPEPNNSLGFFFISGIRRVLPTWQGFTISMIYYFMNKDVQRCIQMSIRKFKSKHQLKYPCFTLHFLPTSTIPTTNSV